MKTNNAGTQLINTRSAGKYLLFGGGIALGLIVVFLLSAGKPKPEWGSYWMIKPLVLVPLAGAAGGMFYYLMLRRFTKGAGRVFATVFSIIMYVVILWIGTVLGLNGTHWD